MSKWLVPTTLILVSIVLFFQIGFPLTGRWAYDDTLYFTIARNYLRYGLKTTKLGMVRNVEGVKEGDFDFFNNHPPLHPLSLALSMAIFGAERWAARLVPILFTLGSLVTLFFLAREVFGSEVARWALLAGALTPAILWYGQQIGLTPITLFWGLQVFLWFWLFKKRGRGYFYLLSLVSMAFAVLSDWNGYYVAGCLTVYVWLEEGSLKKSFRQTGLYWVVAISGFASFLFLNRAHQGSFYGGGALEIFTRRFFVGFLRSDKFPLAYLKRLLGQALVVFGPLVVVVLSIGGLTGVRGVQMGRGKLFLGCLFLWGLIHPLLFPYPTYYHEFLLIFLWPGISIWTGWLLAGLMKEARWRFVLTGLTCCQLAFSLVTIDQFTNASASIRAVGRAIGGCVEERATVAVPWDDFALSYFSERDLIRGVEGVPDLLELSEGKEEFSYVIFSGQVTKEMEAIFGSEPSVCRGHPELVRFDYLSETTRD